jgi:histidinol-phosphate aminotransferase
MPPSDANFVMLALSDAAKVTDHLLRQGIIVRGLSAFGLPNAIRISTGTDEENQLLIDAWNKL